MKWQVSVYHELHASIAIFLFNCDFFGKVELNEIESRAEEYPLTRAFCHLIGTLVESSFPSNLGAGLRPPGFEPYLDFLRDSVFLRFNTRAYRRPAEKVHCEWIVQAILSVASENTTQGRSYISL